MSFLAHRGDDLRGRLGSKGYLFHALILAFLCLNFFVACGYKGAPVYEVRDENNSVIKSREFRDLNRW